MKPTFNEKLIAYLALLSGLSLSGVAIYYSVLGLTAIFAAAAIPIIIMGVVLEVSKLIATLWLKQNWNIAPRTIKGYLIAAIVTLMLITSMGIFGFLSKAHNDQTLVSGDVLAKISIYDEKIKTAKENIEADRKQLKQMDEAVDQVMARSTTEEGASKANAIRKAQARDRSALAKNIEANQKLIAALNDEAAPLRAEVRKVEAEVGPLKYIASFIYGETDTNLLEKAVTWVIIILVLVFDPLAVILLLASQVSFQNFREKTLTDVKKEIEPEVKQEPKKQELELPPIEEDDFDISKHSYLFKTPQHYHPPGIEPVGPIVAKDVVIEKPLEVVEKPPTPISVREESKIVRTKVFPRTTSNVENENIHKLLSDIESNVEKLYIQNEEQTESNLWTNTTTNQTLDHDTKKIAREKFEQRIQEHVDMVKSARISMSEVPEDILPIVKSRV